MLAKPLHHHNHGRDVGRQRQERECEKGEGIRWERSAKSFCKLS